MIQSEEGNVQGSQDRLLGEVDQLLQPCGRTTVDERLGRPETRSIFPASLNIKWGGDGLSHHLLTVEWH